MIKDIKDVALRHLEYRERSTYEVKKHLKEKGYPESEIEEAIDYLQEFHYLDDARYCEHYMNYALSKGKGSLRIKRELGEKGISSELIQTAIENQLDYTMEWENAMKQVEKIIGISHTSDDEEGMIQLDSKLKAKIGRRLSSLGYHTGMIYEILGKIEKR